jgi:hypothetical protein
MNSEYNNNNKEEEHTFLCYTNSRINKKIKLATTGIVQDLKFELFDNILDKKIDEEEIKTLRIELLLELFPSTS